MIKTVLLRISERKTLAEIAEELDIEYSAILGMIKHLEKMGYIKSVEREEREKGLCKLCPLYKVCSKKGLKIYYLTDKGKKLISS